jgi:hypothetical protein
MATIPLQRDITIYQGSTLTIPLLLKNSDGTVFNLTDWTPTGQVRTEKNGTAELLASFTGSTDVATGRCTWTIGATVTATIEACGYFDLELHHNSDEDNVKRIMQGRATLDRQVTT